MPPPNFARKKRKSHSRGSSARRTRHKNTTSGKPDQRSSSVDVTSLSSTSKEVLDDSGSLNNTSQAQTKITPDISQASQNLKSLHVGGSEDTSVIHIDCTEDSLQKKSPSKKRTNKKASKKNIGRPACENLNSEASGNSSVNNFLSVNDSLSIKMVQEDNLDKLSELLERLDATYKVDSCESTPSQGNPNSRPNTNTDALATTTNKLSNFKVNSCESTPSHGDANLQSNDIASTSVPFKDKSEEHSAKEETLSQEEKKALRKARKEAKKSGKPVAAVVQLTSNSIDSVSAPQESEERKAATVVSSSDIGKPEKSKADLKRERREKQEAQRAAKLAAKAENESSATKNEPVQKKLSVSEKVSTSASVTTKKDVLKSRRRLPLFEHLSIPKIDENLSSFNETRIHPAMRTAGICMKDFEVDGSLARVITTLSAISSLIEDYHTPSSCDLSRDLSDYLSSNIAFLNACRPLSEPINNAIRFVKKEINGIKNSVPESQAKEILLTSVDSYIHQNILLASKTLVQNAQDFIEDDNVILTFGMSQLVKETIIEASKTKDNLSVVVADNPATGFGTHFVKQLSDLKIKVHYRILSDLSRIMKKVSKVIVEAEAVVLNGAVIGHCGMAGLILLASTYSVPVIVLSHTFKFCNIDLTDSLVVNELGDPSVIVNCPSHKFRNYLENWKASPNMNIVNLMYDVTPPELINVLVTESSNYPTSVVPVIIRKNYADILGHD